MDEKKFGHRVRSVGQVAEIASLDPNRARMKTTELLASALTLRSSSLRTDPLPRTFESAEDAVQTMMHVLLHEGKEDVKEPLPRLPDNPYLHLVDVDSDHPGIVDRKDEFHVLRCDASKSKGYPYTTPRALEEEEEEEEPPLSPPPVLTDEQLEKEAAKERRKQERHACTLERREAKRREKKEERERETPEERATRLAEAKRKREAKKEEETAAPKPARPQRPPPPPPSLDALLAPDTSTQSSLDSEEGRRKKKERVFACTVPHHRHLMGLQRSRPSAGLLRAVLSGGRATPALTLVDGPPGTGKTQELVRRIPSSGRVLLCAPTNMGAINLYQRCLAEDKGDDASLVLAPERIPKGTRVESNDPTRRIVCATVSSRGGPMLNRLSFDHVMVDEAAQCMEAWTWTLLREDVRTLTLAGDVKQLPSLVSETGRELGHDRSLMERLLVDCQYEGVVRLRSQNRMAPQIMELSNRFLYGGTLSCGPHAPLSGRVEVRLLEDGAEEEHGSSYRNRAEAEAVKQLAAELEEEGVLDQTVVLTPYAAQCTCILAQKTGVPVHTIDSFQGREAEVVVVSMVRSGPGFGFWADERRVNVALTRARSRLVLLASGAWPPHLVMTQVLQHAAAA